MEFAFDLISDLHLESWGQTFDLTGLATSPHCIVTGDVCRDRSQLYATLKHLSTCYQAVFYIDGNDEHKDHMDSLGDSYKDLMYKINRIPNVVYLQDNVVIVNGVAIVGTNGWWGYDFDSTQDPEEVKLWLQEKEGYSESTIQSIRHVSNIDTNYIVNSVKRLQTHPDVAKIVIATHTVPRPDLIEHDVSIKSRMQFNCMGNRWISSALAADTERKVHTWCFGHYHGKVDQYRDGVRWVNHCRGRKDSPYSQWVYYPMRIVVEY